MGVRWNKPIDRISIRIEDLFVFPRGEHPAPYDPTDSAWSVIQPLLPNNSRSVPRVEDQRVLYGTFRRSRTNAP